MVVMREHGSRSTVMQRGNILADEIHRLLARFTEAEAARFSDPNEVLNAILSALGHNVTSICRTCAGKYGPQLFERLVEGMRLVIERKNGVERS